jgi:hypothetical protein
MTGRIHGQRHEALMAGFPKSVEVSHRNRRLRKEHACPGGSQGFAEQIQSFTHGRGTDFVL